MVKLIRLASRDVQGVFRAQLQNDLVLTPNSKIAVLNLTFSSNSLGSVVDQENSLVDFSGSSVLDPDQPFAIQPLIQSKIFEGTYTEQNYVEFVSEVERALNRCLDMTPTQPPNGVPPRLQAHMWNTVCSEFYIPKREGDLFYQPETEINFRYSILITPLGGQGPVQLPPNDSMTQNDPAWEGSYTNPFVGGLITPNFDFNIANNTIQLSGSATAGNHTKFKFITEGDMKMSKGASLYLARVHLLSDNGSGAQDNGFGIGLTSKDLGGDPDLNILLDTVDIPGVNREFEIRCNRPGEPYKYISNNGLEANSGVNPQKTGAGTPVIDHDIMWFMINKGVLTGGVWMDNGTTGVQEVFFRHVLTDDQATNGFYPYLYMRGTSANCVASGVAYSCTSFISGNNDYAITGMEDSGILFNMLAGNVDASNVGLVVPYGDEFRLGFPFFNGIPNQTIAIRLHLQVWHMLGFSSISFEDDLSGYRTVSVDIGYNQRLKGWVSLLANDAANKRALSDNYIIEILNVPTDSYDASRSQYGRQNITDSLLSPNLGRRKNILMTIPVNDNASGTIVEYDTVYPIFIDLQNSENVNLRNLQIRILDKKFKQINTSGESIITLLVEN